MLTSEASQAVVCCGGGNGGHPFQFSNYLFPNYSLRSPILFSPTPTFFPFTPNSGACCQASKLSFVGFSVLICQSISKTPCRIFVFDCRGCRHNINRQSFCHRLCFDRELDFVIYECSIPRFEGCKRYERSNVF